MFTSSLEVAKFEGANIRTVSGIRGQVKKALPKPEGQFRATFEDKVLMSGKLKSIDISYVKTSLTCLIDIVFLRAWYPVKPRKFYNPVTSLLLSSKSDWQGMRLTGQVRKDLELHAPQNKDSIYKVKSCVLPSYAIHVLTIVIFISQLNVKNVDSTH
jgi:ribosome biogenesis protein BMS1